MKPTAYNLIWVSLLLLLVLACSAGTVHAQSEEQRDQPAQASGQTGAMQVQRDMEGRQGGQTGMGQMTWPEGMGMRAMQTPLGRIVLVIGVGLSFLLITSTSAALIALTLFLVRRSRVGQPTWVS